MSFVGPFPVEAVIERLRTIPALRLVGGVASQPAAVDTPPRATPAAFVLTEETGSPPDSYTERDEQRIDVAIQVVLWVRHAGSADTGAQGAAAMTALEHDVRQCLRSWVPPTPFNVLWVANSGRAQAFGSQVIRQVIFRSTYHDQEQS